MEEEKQKIKFRHNLREYFSFLSRHKGIMAVLIVFVFFMELKSVLDRYLFKIVVDKGTEFSTGNLAYEAFAKILFVIAIVYLSAVVINSIFTWFRVYFLNRFDAETMYDLKHKYFSHIIELDHNFHTTHKTGSLISRLSRGVSAMERMNDTLIFQFLPLILQFGIAVFALIYLDKISAIIIASVMVLFIGFSYIMQKVSEPSNIILNKTEDKEKGSMADFFTNIESIRYYGKEKYIQSRYKDLTEETKEKALINWDYYNIITAGQTLILGIGTFFLIYFPIRSFITGEITLGTLTFIYTTYVGLIGPLFGFVQGIRNTSRSMADFQELFEYGRIESAIQDKSPAEKLEVEKGQIEFKEVNFSYGKRKIFENFNLKIKPHEKVALVGHSGCGKTTLIKLLYRLYDVGTGGIFVDGKDVKDLQQKRLREEMSIVPQECVLFDDTIFNNIKLSKPNATKDEVLKAIKFAQLDKIIKNFPEKENTVVGERGVKLSGGEKQRVSIARAILADKKVLVLDEATSSLDSETEHEIQKDLQRLLEGRTSIMIAHRLSTIMNADRIIVMKNGKIVQEGKHNELIRQVGEYKKLWNLQKGGYIK